MYVIGARAAGFLGGLGRMGYRPNQAVQRTYVRRRRFLGQDDQSDSGDDTTFEPSQSDILAMTSASPTFSTPTVAAPAPPLDAGVVPYSGNPLASITSPNLANAPNQVAPLTSAAQSVAQIVAGVKGAPSAGTVPGQVPGATVGGVGIGALLAIGGGVFLLAMLAGGGGGRR